MEYPEFGASLLKTLLHVQRLNSNFDVSHMHCSVVSHIVNQPLMVETVYVQYCAPICSFPDDGGV